MSQTAPQGSGPRRTPGVSPDLDALLESFNTDARQAAGSPPPQPVAERSPNTLMERRVQALIRAFDVLHKQVGSIAAQGETISKVAELQAQDGRAIGDLQRNMRYLRAIVIQQLQQSSAGNANLPPLQVKLVVGHLVEQYQQAERDMATLMQWAMLFAGIAIGMGLAAATSVANGQRLGGALFGTVALVTLLVAGIFGGLARTTRTRAVAARRAMDESTLVRSVATTPLDPAERPL